MKAGLPFKYIIAVKGGKNYVVFDYKDDNGKRKRKWVGTELPEKCSKKALNAKIEDITAKFYDEYCSGILTKVTEKKTEKADLSEKVLTSNNQTNSGDYEFTAFMKYWLETIKPTISFNTYEGYRRCIKRICTYFDEMYQNLKLSELSALQIQQFYNDKYNSGLSGNTVKHYHANIHKALKYAIKMDLLAVNPADKVELPKLKKFEANFYNKEELDKLFEAFEGDRMELVIHIAAYYGLRRSEIIGLKWDAIDFNQKTITICRKVISEYGSGKEVVICESELKTAASKRTLPLIPQIEKMLIEHRETLNGYKKLLKSGFDSTYSDYVCCDNFGKLITPEFISNHFRYVVQREGLRKLRFHDLRHSCASLLLANGVPMKAIQDWLGHSNFNVTANFYSHLDYNSKMESAETIARVLGGEETENKVEREENNADV